MYVKITVKIASLLPVRYE